MAIATETVAKIVAGVAGSGCAGLVGCYAGGIIGNHFSPNAPYQNRQEKWAFDEWASSLSGLGKPNTLSAYLSWSYPTWRTWSPQELETKKSGTGTFGEKYGRYLVGVYGHGVNKEEQKKQWEKLYTSSSGTGLMGQAKTYNNDEISKYAKEVSTAFEEAGDDSETPKSLNKFCEKIYNLEKSKVGFEEGAFVLKLCSEFPSVVQKLDTNKSDYSGKIGSKGGNFFVQTNVSNNTGFWDLQDRWFRFHRDEITDLFFKQYAYITRDNMNAVETACEAAYKANEATSQASKEQPLLDDVKKYCSFELQGK